MRKLKGLGIVLGFLICLANGWAQPALPTPPDGRVLNVWNFQTTNWTSLFGESPVAFTNLSLTEDWAGYGLLLDDTNAASLSYPLVSSNGWTNLNVANGSVEFWFSPDWDSGTGAGNSAVLLQSVGDTNAWTLAFSPDGSTLAFSVQASNYLAAPITWYAGDWHHLALTYSSTNTALYLEGAYVTNGSGIPDLFSRLTNTFSFGSDATGLLQARGVFNQLITYDYSLDAATISNFYAYDSQNVFPLPSGGSHFDASPPSIGYSTNYSSGGVSYTSQVFGSNDFWLEVASLTNGCDCDPSINLVLHGTTNGSFYELLCATNLTPPIAWTPEQGTVSTGNSVSFRLPTKNCSMIFVRAKRTALDFQLQPLSQEVFTFDSVTFHTMAGGAGNLLYQWMFNGTNITGATNNAFTLNNVQDANAGNYTVVVISGTNSITSSTAVLTVDDGPGFEIIPVTGLRQDYRFKSGLTYYIGSPVQLYGHTIIEGGAVLKFDYYFDSILQIMDSLECKTEQYFPAILTSVDDDAVGAYLGGLSEGQPVIATNGLPYLDLSALPCSSIENLRICFANQGISGSSAHQDVWNTQFVGCNSAAIIGQDSGISFHNTLFAFCNIAVTGLTNLTSINAEQITADVTNFWSSPIPPRMINLTNSILLGNIQSGSLISTQKVILFASITNFLTSDYGNYYLNTSGYRSAGTTNISPKLLSDLKFKTTFPPFAIPPYTQITDNLTLYPQVARYSTGAPDLGYYYPALDYTVADLTLTGGNLTVMPGVAIATRNDFIPSGYYYTLQGFHIQEGSTFTSHGLPNQPNIFTAEFMVQEVPQTDYSAYAVFSQLTFKTIAFVPDFELNDAGNAAPVLDFSFSQFFLGRDDYQVWGGMDPYGYLAVSYDCAVDFTMRDCSIHGGQINFGAPNYEFYPTDQIFTNGSVEWENNLFDNVIINFNPTYYSGGYDDLGLNVDLSVHAYNNLFHEGWLYLEPIPASDGNWLFQNNLFDQTHILQDTNEPLDFAYNGYWPLLTNDFYGDYEAQTLRSTVTGDGFNDGTNEKILLNPPAFLKGVFGNYYLPTNTLLFHAGSTNAGQLGLYHYTTQTNQAIESNAIVSIGLHYLAASNGVPLDTDGDGIPDYVEDANGNGIVDYGETDWITNRTDGINLDSFNAIYDNVDLDGDGLTGAQEQLFGTNPLTKDNPLDLSVISSNVVSGIIYIPLNISSNAASNIIVTLDGSAASTVIFPTNGQWMVEWDTTEAANGLHQFAFELPIDQDCNTTIASSKYLYVENAISFANDVPIAGTAIFLDPQTIYSDGTWSIAVYDDQGNLFTNLTGDVDTSGLLIDPNTGQLGVSISLLDSSGNQYPSQSYSVEVDQYAPSQTISQAEIKKTIRVKTGGVNGLWAITYQPLFPDYSQGLNDEAEMMQVAADAVSQNGSPSYDSDSIVDSPATASGNIVLATTNTYASWQRLQNDLANIYVKNFFFCGHFDGVNLGGTPDPNVSISISILNYLLQNTPGYSTNAFPYRFVFIDGCNSAKKGELCAAFGIPTKTTTSANMISKGLMPCAFVGWKNVKIIGSINLMNQQHKRFIENFWILWPSVNNNTGRPYVLKDALHDAAYNSSGELTFAGYKDIVIFGCGDLTFQ